MQYEVGNHKWAFITMYLYIKVYNTLSIFASLCHILPPSCSNGFFRRCCGRFTWLTGNRARNPPSEVPKKRNIGISDHHSARTIPYCLTKYQQLQEDVSFFYPIFKFKCKDNSVQSQATKNKKFRSIQTHFQSQAFSYWRISTLETYLYIYIWQGQKAKVKPGIFWVHCRCYHHPKGSFLAGHPILQKFPSS